MNQADARSLLATAIPPGAGTWADFGAGQGTFTRALSELLSAGSRIYAVDRDRNAIRALERLGLSTIIPVVADFTREYILPALGDEQLDGILLANSLHFARDATAVLTRLVHWLKPSGSVVIIEYDERAASPWVPYPLPSSRLAALMHAAGLSTPDVTATRPSAFGGTLYIARATRPDPLQ